MLKPKELSPPFPPFLHPFLKSPTAAAGNVKCMGNSGRAKILNIKLICVSNVKEAGDLGVPFGPSSWCVRVVSNMYFTHEGFKDWGLPCSVD